jgi:hypothetical protein
MFGTGKPNKNYFSLLVKTGLDHMLRSATAGVNPKENVNTSQQNKILSSGRQLWMTQTFRRPSPTP